MSSDSFEKNSINNDDLQIRPFTITHDFTPNALSSVLSRAGNTQIICGMSYSDDIPSWMRGKGSTSAWLIAEYNILPSSTPVRQKRERYKISGRTQEIQRLISRNLRTMMDLEKMKRGLFFIDCDVISADGSTRTTAINGSVFSLITAVSRLLSSGTISVNPLYDESIAAISVALHKGRYIIDPDYEVDCEAEADISVILSESGKIVEIQGCADQRYLTNKQLFEMIEHARNALKPIFHKINNHRKELGV